MPGFLTEKTIGLDEYYANTRVNLIYPEYLFKHLSRKGGKLILTYSADIENRFKTFVREINRFCKCFNNKQDNAFKNLKIEIKPDTLITSEDFSSSSFLIFNTPRSKVFSHYIDTSFPIRVEHDRILIDKDLCEGNNLQVSFTIYNPFNPDRYFVFVTGTVDYPMPCFHPPVLGHYLVWRLPIALDNILEEGNIRFDFQKPVGLESREKYQKDREWLVRASKHHLFYVKPNSLAQKEIESIVELHETAYRDTVDTFKIRTKDKELYVCYLYEKWKEKFRGGYLSHISGEIHVQYDEETKWDYGGPHESIHAITYRHWGYPQPLCWVEGLAMFLDWGDPRGLDWYAAESLYSDSLLPMNDLLDNHVFKEHYGADTYRQAGSMVKFLLRRFGWARLCEMMRRAGSQLKNEKTMVSQLSEIFASVYNLSAEQFWKEWKTYIKTYLTDHLTDIEAHRGIRAARRNIFYKKYPDALINLNLSCDLGEKDPLRLYLAGKCHFLMGSLELAANHFSKSVQLPVLSPIDGFVYRHSFLYLGKIHDLMGKRDQAIGYYNSVLSLPEHDDAHDEARSLIGDPFKHDMNEKDIDRD